jgi:hypothetical protein
MASKLFDSFQDDVDRGNIVPSVDTFKRMLISAAGVAAVNAGTMSKRSDFTSYEVTGSGYVAGGSTCAATVTKDATNHRNEISFAQTTWASSTITAAGSIVYKSRGGVASADELVLCNDFGGNVSSSGGPFTVNADTIRRQNP